MIAGGSILINSASSQLASVSSSCSIPKLLSSASVVQPLTSCRFSPGPFVQQLTRGLFIQQQHTRYTATGFIIITLAGGSLVQYRGR